MAKTKDPAKGNRMRQRRITARDQDILRFINYFGFCNITHIQRKFGVKQARSYQLVTKLIEMGLVQHEMVFDKAHGFYWLTREGAKYTTLPALHEIPVLVYKHQFEIMNVYFKLREQYPKAKWVSERELQQEKYRDGIGKYGHLPDGILVLTEEEQIAIEIELSMKGKERLAKILRSYAKTDYKVWYFCSAEIWSRVEKATARYSFIKTYNLEEFINE